MSGRPWWFFGPIADGITLGAEMLCPVDHTAVRRAQAAADALADREAEVDHLEPYVCPCGTSTEAGCAVACTDPLAKSRAVGLQHAASPREESGPIPDLSPSLGHSTESVTQEELADRLIDYAIRTNTGHIEVLVNAFARDLLDDFTITKK